MRKLSSRLVGLALSVTLCACAAFLPVDDHAAIQDPDDAADEGAASSREGGAGDASGIDSASELPDGCTLAASCLPELITKLDAPVLRLVAANGALYVATRGSSSRVLRVSSAPPGSVVDLDPGAAVVDLFRGDSNVVVDATDAVYWGTPNGLRRHESDGGVTSLSELGAPVSGLRIVDGRLHFAVNGPAGVSVDSGHLASCALPGCSDVQVALYAPYPIDLVAMGAQRYWLGTDTALQHLALRGTGNIAASGDQDLPSLLVNDAQRIYWSAVEGLRMFTPATATVTDLLPAPTDATSRVNGIALETDGTLYLTQKSQLLRCSVVAGSCVLATLAEGPGTALAVTFDPTFIYWGTSDGSLLRLRKQ